MQRISLNEVKCKLTNFLETELSSLTEENLKNILNEIYDAEGNRDISGFDAERLTLIKWSIKKILNNKR